MNNTAEIKEFPIPMEEPEATDLISHLMELRTRLIYCVMFFFVSLGVCYYFSEHIFQFLVEPLATLLKDHPGHRLIYTGLTEAFVTYIKVSFFAAAFFSFPILAVQVWKFIAPGLFKSEKKVFLSFLMTTPVLFVLGAGFAYYFILPNAWSFFLSFETPGGAGQLPIQLEARVHEYLSLVMQLVLAFGISFQLPIVLILLARIGIVKVETLKKNRKYAFLFIMIASAFLTPPDVLSMLGLAFPLYILYEISLVAVKYTARKKNINNELEE
jgi:sec-independent protein translocase protein TatC